MSLIWSSGSGASNPHYVGMDIARSGKTVTCDYWAKATYAVEDNQTLNRLVNGSSVGTVGYYKSGPAAVKVSTRSFEGTANTTYTLRAYLSNVYNGGAPDLSLNVTIPPDVPAAPTGASVARVSDTQHTVEWTNNATSGAPYTNLFVERSVDGGAWAAVATLGVVTSYSATTSADHSYQFRVKARNSSGDSGYAYTSTVYTTPSAPTIGSASKSGTDIVVAWDHTARYPTGAKVYASQDGGAYALLATITSTAETYTHPSPNPAVTWTYKVTATNGSLESALSAASITVQLEAAPSAPTLISPTGVVAAAEDVVFQWQHNPVDTSAQTAYEVQYRPSGGAWTTVSTGALEAVPDVWFITVTGGTLTNGLTYEWQARTKGAHADWSPYSALGSFPTSARPTVVVNYPDSTAHTGSTVTAKWGYFDAESTAQAQWRATLTNGSTTEVLSGSGTATEATFTTVLPDASTWDVTVEVRDGAGLWSTPDTVTFTVDYAPPPTPVLTALYNAPTGSTALMVTNPDPVSPEVATDHNNLYRSLDAGQTWTLIGEDLPVDGSMVDPLPLVGGSTLYKAVAVSTTPSTADSLTVGVDTTDPAAHQGWCFANWGDGFTTGVRLRANVRVNSDRERAKVLRHYSDRPDPVEHAGPARTHTLTVSARILPGDESTRDELEALADAPAPICWRDPTGRRVFVSSGRVSTSAFHMEEEAGVALTRVHHVE